MMHFSLPSCAWIFALFPFILNADALYVSTGSNTVEVIAVPSFQIVATITVGNTPQLPIVTPDQQRVYVANGLSDTVSVIDTSTNSVIATIMVGLDPFQLSEHAITPDGQFIYIGNSFSEDISVISTATNTVIATIPVANASNAGTVSEYPFVLPNGQFVYFPLPNQKKIIKISTATNTIVATIPIGGTSGDPSFILGPSNNSQIIYVLDQGNDNVVVLDTTTDTITATIHVGSLPFPFRISADNLYIYIDNFLSSNVSVISTASNTVVSTIPLTVQPGVSPSISLNNTTAYIPCPNAGQVNVVSRISGTVVATITTAPSSSEETYTDPSVTWVFALNSGSNNVSVISTATNSVIATVSMPDPTTGAYVRSISPATSSKVSGEQIANRFLTQTDFINVVQWTPPANFTPVIYEIFRDAALTILAGTVSGSTLEFKDHNRKKKTAYSYFIIAKDQNGNTTTVGNVTVSSFE